MGAYFGNKIRRTVTAEVAGVKISRIETLSAISQGKVMEVLGDSEAAKYNVPCKTAIVEILPGLNKRVTGFGDKMGLVSSLKVGDIADFVGTPIPGSFNRSGNRGGFTNSNGDGFRLEELHGLKSAPVLTEAEVAAKAKALADKATASAAEKTNAVDKAAAEKANKAQPRA